MVKYKCFKTQCPICRRIGSLQLFINRQGRITYSRVRHHQGKAKYTYCKIENLEALKTLLSNKGIQLTTYEANSGQLGQVGQGVRFELLNCFFRKTCLFFGVQPSVHSFLL